jgi:topoisomerase-4 subunit A
MADDMSTPPEEGGRIVNEPIADALSRRFLSYALSTITARAVPDVRDGLKPVHRRILYGMYNLGLSPDAAFKKSAKIVGDVMGDFHPHGDTAIYDAMVRLAQDFASRYPLVDGQGNFGNIDGDNPAAYRYTEARMTQAALLLLEGIDEDAVDFRENYAGDKEEPVVLPAAFPNLLANGSVGIAVGMATSIPPHNVAELIDASLHLIQHPSASVDDLIRLVPGPDFPTGGVIVEPKDAIREAYATGRGGFRVRAKWEVEEMARGTWRVIVTEIPYQVQKSKLIGALAELVENKKAPLLGDVRDESAETIRIVLEPRARTVEPAVLMESLFKLSELETRVPLNMNVLDAHGAPRVMNLKEVLKAFLDHRRDVLQRRSRRRLAKIAARLEILAGLLIVYLNLDEVIRIIRREDEPKPALIKRFKLTDVQADAILNTRLRQLRKLEEMELRAEDKALREEQADLELLLSSEARQWTRVGQQLKKTRAVFAESTPWGARRVTFGDGASAPEVSADAFIVREPITVVLSEKGWVRALKGHAEDVSGLKYKEGDREAFVLRCETTDKLILMATDGRAFTIGADKLPGGRGMGEPIRLMIELGEDQDLIAMFAYTAGAKMLVASSDGYGFIVPEDEMLATKRAGKQVLAVSGMAFAQVCTAADGDHVAVIGENRKLLVFTIDELPEMARGKGVRLQAYKDGGLSDAVCFNKADGLTWVDSSGRTRVVAEWREHLAKRATSGRTAPRGFSRSGRFHGE